MPVSASERADADLLRRWVRRFLSLHSSDEGAACAAAGQGGQRRQVALRATANSRGARLYGSGRAVFAIKMMAEGTLSSRVNVSVNNVYFFILKIILPDCNRFALPLRSL